MALSDRFTKEQIEHYRMVCADQWKSVVLALVCIFFAGSLGAYLFHEEISIVAGAAKSACSRQVVFDSNEVRPNGDPNAEDTWRICIYNGASKHLFGMRWTAGGADFKRAAECSEFTHCADATTPQEATAALSRFRELAKARGKKVAVVAVIDHSAPASPSIGEPLGSSFFSEVRRLASECGTTDLFFLGCNVARGTTGSAYAHIIADFCGVKVHAATRAVDSAARLPGKTYVQALIESGKFIVVTPAT